MAVNFGIADFRTGDRVVDLPVLAGASWAAMLNKPDELSCTIDLRDPDVLALDPTSTTEPKKTVLFAEAPNGAILAWGVISEREWDEDARTLDLTASGGWQYFNQRIIAPAAAESGTIVLPDGKVTEVFDTKYAGTTLGSIGIELVAQALDWPGAPLAFDLPAPDDGDHESELFRLVDFKTVGEAITDLTKREDGPDFAFDARRADNGIALVYRLRVGDPYFGDDVGSWPLGGPASPISGFKVTDDGGDIATHVWMQAGRTDSKVLVARSINTDLRDVSGYPVLDMVDTAHTDVTLQGTLDAYAAENAARASKVSRELKFKVKGNASLALGQYRPGDWVRIDVPDRHPYLRGDVPIRLLSIAGDETGTDVTIGCVVGERPAS